MEPFDCAIVEFSEVIGLHGFRCYLHVASQSLTPLQFSMCLYLALFRLIPIARYVFRALNISSGGRTKFEIFRGHVAYFHSKF